MLISIGVDGPLRKVNNMKAAKIIITVATAVLSIFSCISMIIAVNSFALESKILFIISAAVTVLFALGAIALFIFARRLMITTVMKINLLVVMAILTLCAFYYIFNVISAPTGAEYLATIGKNLLFFIIFGLPDIVIILLAKPLYGFTSVFDNIAARKTLKAREKAAKKEIEETAKATLAAAKAARKAEAARNK